MMRETSQVDPETPIPAIALEYSRESLIVLAPVLRALGLLTLVIGALSVGLSVLSFVNTRGAVANVGLEFTYWIVSGVVAIFQIVAGAVAARRNGSFKLLSIWAWCAIAYVIVACGIRSLSYYMMLRQMVPRFYSNFAIEMLYNFTLAGNDLVAPIVVIIVYRYWKRSNPGHG